MTNKEKPDLQYEGKEDHYLDIDRIIDEGLAGGTVHRFHGKTNIEEAHEIGKEEPPHHINKSGETN